MPIASCCSGRTTPSNARSRLEFSSCTLDSRARVAGEPGVGQIERAGGSVFFNAPGGRGGAPLLPEMR